MNSNIPPKLRIFGVVDVCPTTINQFVETFFNLPRASISSTVNLIGVPAIISAKENHKYEEMYNSATFPAIDGMPIVKMARRKGYKCDRCAAQDIMKPILNESIKHGYTHYFYGGKNETILQKLRTNLMEMYPSIEILGMYSPPFRELTAEEDKILCDEINKLKPDIIWVGIGAPKQEMWILKHRDKIHNTVMIGVGAGFDYLAGTLKVAPKWIKNAGLEWLFRLVMEPKRLYKRYVIGGGKFISYVLLDEISNFSKRLKGSRDN